MVRRLAHICIRSTDLAATEAFYCNGLGLERFFDFEKDGELFGFYLKAGSGTFIEVFRGEADKPGNINHVALEVDDLDATLAHLEKQGIEHTAKKMGSDQSWQAWLTDPDGVRIELHHYTENSSQRTRRKCIVNW